MESKSQVVPSSSSKLSHSWGVRTEMLTGVEPPAREDGSVLRLEVLVFGDDDIAERT